MKLRTIIVALMATMMSALPACGGATDSADSPNTGEPTATATSAYTQPTYTQYTVDNPCFGAFSRTYELPYGPLTGLCGLTHARLRMQGGTNEAATNDNGTGAKNSSWVPSIAPDGNWQIRVQTMTCGDHIELGWSCEPWSNFARGAPPNIDEPQEMSFVPPNPGVYDSAIYTDGTKDEMNQSFMVPMGVIADFSDQNPNNFDALYSDLYTYLDMGSRLDEIGMIAASYRWDSYRCPQGIVNVNTPVATDSFGDICRWVPSGQNSTVLRPADNCGTAAVPNSELQTCFPGYDTPQGPQNVSCFVTGMAGPFGQSHIGLYGGFDVSVPITGSPYLTVVGTELEGTPAVHMDCIEKQNF